jgi:hypothetical protein
MRRIKRERFHARPDLITRRLAGVFAGRTVKYTAETVALQAFTSLLQCRKRRA